MGIDTEYLFNPGSGTRWELAIMLFCVTHNYDVNLKNLQFRCQSEA